MLVDLEIEMKSSDLLGLKRDLIKVSDSRGRFYDIKKMIIRENISQTQNVRIFVDGAPRWWGVKFFVVEFEQGFLGHDRKVELRKSSADVTRLEVDTLSTCIEKNWCKSLHLIGAIDYPKGFPPHINH